MTPTTYFLMRYLLTPIPPPHLPTSFQVGDIMG